MGLGQILYEKLNHNTLSHDPVSYTVPTAPPTNSTVMVEFMGRHAGRTIDALTGLGVTTWSLVKRSNLGTGVSSITTNVEVWIGKVEASRRSNRLIVNTNFATDLKTRITVFTGTSHTPVQSVITADTGATTVTTPRTPPITPTVGNFVYTGVTFDVNLATEASAYLGTASDSPTGWTDRNVVEDRTGADFWGYRASTKLAESAIPHQRIWNTPSTTKAWSSVAVELTTGPEVSYTDPVPSVILAGIGAVNFTSQLLALTNIVGHEPGDLIVNVSGGKSATVAVPTYTYGNTGWTQILSGGINGFGAQASLRYATSDANQHGGSLTQSGTADVAGQISMALRNVHATNPIDGFLFTNVAGAGSQSSYATGSVPGITTSSPDTEVFVVLIASTDYTLEGQPIAGVPTVPTATGLVFTEVSKDKTTAGSNMAIMIYKATKSTVGSTGTISFGQYSAGYNAMVFGVRSASAPAIETGFTGWGVPI